MDFFIFTFFLLLLRNSQRFSNSSLLHKYQVLHCRVIGKHFRCEIIHLKLRFEVPDWSDVFDHIMIPDRKVQL